MATIKYAQCWEDSDVLRRALVVGPDDDVVSIASGGDNTLALLLDGPKSLTAVDLNPAQLHLLELKMRAIQMMDYEDFICFVGARPCNRRPQLFRLLRNELSQSCACYWDRNTPAIERGVIHAGKFERYLRVFRKIVLPLIHSRKTIEELLATGSITEQREFYRASWDTRRWRLYFLLFFSRALLGAFGRDRSHFQYVEQLDVASELLARSTRGLTEIPIRNNFLLHYILTGQYRDLETAPSYLRSANFAVLQERVPSVRLYCGELTRLLHNYRAGSFSRFNLSDIPEYLAPNDVRSLAQQLFKVSRPQSRAAFWTLFIPRTVPTGLKTKIHNDKSLASELMKVDRGFFYGSFNLWHLNTARVGRRSPVAYTAGYRREVCHA